MTKAEFLAMVKTHMRNFKNEWLNGTFEVDTYIMGIYNSGNNADKCLDDIILDKSGWHIHEV